MANPAISSVNLLTGATVSSSSGPPTYFGELIYPIANSVQQWINKKFKTNHDRSFVVTSKNCKIRFKYNATNFTATLTAGVYRGVNLAAEVARAMNAAASVATISCIYATTGGFTISTSAAVTFQLLGGTWTADTANMKSSAFPTLGYSQRADKTGSTSYTSDVAVKGTWGYFEIVASLNDKFYWNDGSARTSTLTAGWYSAQELCAEIRYQMWVTNNLRTDTDVAYNRSIGANKFVVARAGNNTMNLATGANSINSTIGWSTSATGVYDGSTETQLIAPAIRIHTSNDIIFDFGSAQTFGNGIVAIVFGHNFSSSATVLLQGSANASTWTTIHTFTYNATMLINLFPTWSNNFRYYRFLVTDPANSVGHVEYGVCWLGSYSRLNKVQGWKHVEGSKSISDKAVTMSGNSIGARRGAAPKGFSFPLANLDDTTKDLIEGTFDAVDITDPWVWMEDTDSERYAGGLYKRTKLVTFASEPEFTPVSNNTAGGFNWNTTLRLMEQK